MTTSLIKRWVTALRSGDYKQVRQALKANDSFCCLGVLADVIDPEGWDDNDGDPTHELVTDQGSTRPFGSTGLPRSLSALTESAQDTLTGMNDAERKTFDEIADWIEVNL